MVHPFSPLPGLLSTLLPEAGRGRAPRRPSAEGTLDWRWRAGDLALVLACLVLDLLIWGRDGNTRWGWSVPPWLVAGSGILAFSTLLVRRTRPWTAFGCLWLYSVVWGALLPTYQPFTGLLVALFTIVRHARLPVAAAALVALVPPWTINTVNASLAGNLEPAVVTVTAVVWSAMAGTVFLAARLGYRAERMSELRAAKAAAEAELALHREQLRMARELHDIVAHSVNAIMFQAAGARQLLASRPDRWRLGPAVQGGGTSREGAPGDEAHGDLAPGDAAPGDGTPEEAAIRANDGSDPLAGTLQVIEETSTRAMRELRGLLGLLRPESESRPGTPTATLAGVPELLASTRACAVEVAFGEQGRRLPLDPATDHTAYRVLQEALANVMTHGGAGASADVRLAWEPHLLRIRVSSRSAAGHPPAARGVSSGSGLAGLAARVTEVGGRLTAGAAEDGSFVTAAELPVRVVAP